MTSAPQLRRGADEAADDPRRERQLRRPRPTDVRMSVCFEVCPPRPGGEIPDRDARRVGTARKLAVAWLRFCGLEALVDDAKLIVSELVTNAIQHGDGQQITMTMTVRDGLLHLAVHNETPGRPVARDAPSDAERGRGLFLVDFLAAAHGGTWGTDHDGATIWCTLAVDGRS
ncbi:ATP-binding protein [Streptomyces sp. NPDC014764]|uniref:ATP-binding protein n=1 Tax=Streptomyces sp. NPDC014764 TaxID=3364907 RepID=UPI0036F8C5EE